jgi:RHS repeat-associated protein
LANASGAVTLARSYQPYGSVMSSVGTGTTNYDFTGEWRDNTGLLHLRARYLSTQVGRFLTKDSWTDYHRPMSFNAWLYVYANPTNLTDPTGQVPCDMLPPEDQQGCLGNDPADPNAPPPPPPGYYWLRSETMWTFSHYIYALESDAKWYGPDRQLTRPTANYGAERTPICLYVDAYQGGLAHKAGIPGNQPNGFNCTIEEFLWGFLYGYEGVTMQGSGRSDFTHSGEFWISYQGSRPGAGWNAQGQYYNDPDSVIFARDHRVLEPYTNIAADTQFSIGGHRLQKGDSLYAPGLKFTPAGSTPLTIKDRGGGIKGAILDQFVGLGLNASVEFKKAYWRFPSYVYVLLPVPLPGPYDDCP